MTSGIWLIFIIPAVLSFVFSVWVTISIVADVAERGASQLALRQNMGQGVVKLKEGQGVVKLKEGQGVVKLKVLPPLHESNNS